jgi:hypothetical protein
MMGYNQYGTGQQPAPGMMQPNALGMAGLGFNMMPQGMFGMPGSNAQYPGHQVVPPQQ